MYILLLELFFDFFVFHLGRSLQICLVGQGGDSVGDIGIASFEFVNDLSILYRFLDLFLLPFIFDDICVCAFFREMQVLLIY